MLSAMLALALFGAPGTPAVATTVQAPKVKRRTAKKKRRKRRRTRRSKDPWAAALTARPWPRWQLTLAPELSLWAGRRSGLGLRPAEGHFAGLEARVQPQLRQKRGLHVDADLRYRHLETIGYALPERRLSGLLLGSYPIAAATRFVLVGKVDWRARPGWLDLYQPHIDATGAPTGGWRGTERKGRRTVSGALRAAHRFGDGLRLTGDVALRQRTDVQDPGFDPVLAPNHLTPTDQRRWSGGLKLGGRTADRFWRYSVGARAGHTAYGYLFARDAGTAATHAAVGGTPANPLRALWTARIKHRSSFWLKPLKLRVALKVAYTHTEDVWAGYYSSEGAMAGVSLRLRPRSGWVLSGGLEGAWRWCGTSGYAEGPTHPPLDDGAHRRARRLLARGRVAHTLWHKRLTIWLEGSMIRRETNFPDYVPQVYPASRAYSINWDADTWQTRLGLTVSVD